MIDEGYIKFQAQWTKQAAFPTAKIQELNHWRQEMYQLDLIGAYPNGIGYGNISQRWNEHHQFLITGSKTGNFETLTSEHFCLVQSVDIDENNLQCRGPIIASSESMSHAVVYQSCPEVHAVIHIHDLDMWRRLLNVVPTTSKDATYGSPEMAYAIMDLLATTDLRTSKLFVMHGHEEGIFAFGATFEEAAAVLKQQLIW